MMSPAELESLATRKLARLPSPRAPHSLLPRVVAEIRRKKHEHWFRRPWATWPQALQVVSPVVCAAVVWLAGTALGRVAEGEVGALFGAIRILWRIFLEPNVGYLAVLIGVMGMASALFFAALSRMLSDGSPEG